MIYGGGGLVAKLCLTLATPWAIACQAPLSMGFSRQDNWSGLPFPSQHLIQGIQEMLLRGSHFYLFSWYTESVLIS